MTLTLGRTHPHTLGTKHNLAYALANLRRHDEAAAIHREVLMARRSTLGDRHHDTLVSAVELGDALLKLDQLVEAEPLLSQGLEDARDMLDSGDEGLAR